MKIKNISVGDFVQVKKELACNIFKAKQVCEVIKIDSEHEFRPDVLIQGECCLGWVNHNDIKKPIKREPKPQLKQLDQSVFDGLDERWVAASVEENGIVRLYLSNENNPYDCEYHLAGTKYDTTDWQNSLIERDIAKELAEVDLSSELTGSDLARAMLARGDKYVMCVVGTHKEVVVINGIDGEDFTSRGSHLNYHTPIPINNQGEPLTAAEAGF